MHGYSGTPLPKKLGVKDGHRVAIVGAPKGFTLDGVPTTSRLGGALDVIVAFVTKRADLEQRLGSFRKHMTPACGLWIAFPKKASHMPTDVTEHVVRELALPTGLVDNKVCAIDDTWTGLRLVIRKELR
ncbi:MAG TPA: hypothetical protein VGG74_31460 [Kofleriaceae bacterium]